MVKQRKFSHGQILAAVSLLILLGFGLRLFNLDAFSFWTDEGLTPLRSGYSLAKIFTNQIIIQEAITKDTHPPLYYLIVHFTKSLWGQTDFAYRYPSLLAGVLLIPLLYQFGRRLQNERAGLLAALLVAINPLQIYYGNEARMYTFLALLAAAASYVLWRALDGDELRRNLLIYLVLAGLAFYTHYTAAFLIAAQGLFWIWLLWHAGHKKLLAGVALTAVLLLIPVIPFTVPRLFTGAETNYYYVQPLVMLHDVIRFFALGVTFDFSHWSNPILELAIFILFIIGVWAAKPWKKRLFLLVYLLAVVLGLMAGSLLKPMYQGVRHIMAGSPALLLLLAIGTDFLFSIRPGQTAEARRLVGLAAFLLFLAPLTGSILALNNLYNDPHYTKQDYRSLIRKIEAHAGERDTVLLHNAILLPLYEHYRVRQDLPATALPVYPHLADGVEAQLAELGNAYDRIWFIPGAPPDGRDPEHKVPTWLENHLERADISRTDTDGKTINVIGYRTAPLTLDALPRDVHELDLSWGDLPQIMGIESAFSQPATGETLWFDIYWQGGTSIPDEGMRLQLRLLDEEGDSWAENSEPLAREITAWPETGFARRSYKLPIPAGTPPGTYTLVGQAFHKDDAPIHEEETLAGVQLAATGQESERSGVIFDNGLILQDIELFDNDVRPGHTLPFVMYWGAAEGESPDLNGIRYTLDVINPSGELLRSQGGKPGADWLNNWPEGAMIRDISGLYFYPDTEPGEYRLRWQMQTDGDPVSGRPYWRPWASETIDFGTVKVVPWPLNKELPQNGTIVEADFGPAIQLHSYDLTQPNAERLEVELNWLARGVPDQSYAIFVHLTDAQNDDIVSQVDRLPVDGLRPTTGWRAGEVLSDKITLQLPTDIEPGDYAINIGFYDPDNGQRLPVSMGGELQPDGQLGLLTIDLP